jgi:hypothetical protein
MRKIFKTLWLCLPVIALSANAAVEQVGVRSCKRWLEVRADSTQKLSQLADEAWLGGFMSGVVTATGKDALKGMSLADMARWMDTFCKSNRSEAVSTGGLHLYLELKTKAGL